MSSLRLNSTDIIWSYLGTFFQISSYLIVLPFALAKLSPNEIGLNYLLMTIGQLVALFDFGFAPQFGRNISYIYGGAQQLKKEGIHVSDNNKINYHLLAVMIGVAKMVYRRLSTFVLAILLTLGSLYVYFATEGFSLVNNALSIWLIFCFSTYINIYYTYFSSLLLGAGLITKSKQVTIISKISNIVLSIVLIQLGLGLMGLCIANLVSPFVFRYLSYKFYFTPDIKKIVNENNVTKDEIHELFLIVWHNAKKMGLVFVSTFAINKTGMFLAGVFLTLEEVGSYGLLIQLVGFMCSLSLVYFTISEPMISSLRASTKDDSAFRKFSATMIIFYSMYILGTIIMVCLMPSLLDLIHTNTKLPSASVILLFCVVYGLEQHHSCFGTFIVTDNKVPFVKPSIVAGFMILLLSFCSLKFTSLGIVGLIIIQGVCQLVYNNWKWPCVVLSQYKCSFINYLSIGLAEISSSLRRSKYELL